MYRFDDDGVHGATVAANDRFIIYAVNSLKWYSIIIDPYVRQKPCIVTYLDSDQFVYSLATIFTQKDFISSDIVSFIQVAENMQTNEIHLSLIRIDSSICNHSGINSTKILLWSGVRQQYMLIKVAPSQNYAYGISDSFLFSFDIEKQSVITLIDTALLFPNISYVPHAFDITEEWGVIIGSWSFSGYRGMALYLAFVIRLQPLERLDFLVINGWKLYKSSITSLYSRENDMSVAINHYKRVVVIGLPILHQIVLLDFQTTDTKQMINISIARIITGPDTLIEFGRSVTWIDNETLALITFSFNNQIWSRSEIRVYNIDSDFQQPLFVFPNHQQTIYMQNLPYFSYITSWSGNLAILTDQTGVLVLPKMPPGFCATSKSNYSGIISMFKQSYCISGTYRNESGLGPCLVCPPGTKNPGNKPSIECEPCLPDRFCPMGSINDTLTDNSYPSYTQTYTYPESPDMSNFDDLLLHYVLSYGTSARCLTSTPIFWTILLVVVSTMIGTSLIALKKLGYTSVDRYYRFFRRFFENANILNDGKHWISGIFSFGIIVLSGFAFWFAAEYIQLYPIENSERFRFFCGSTIHNSLFDNGLQLSLPNSDGSSWPIINMLDEQQITLSLDLINTRATCSHISFEQFNPVFSHLSLPIEKCFVQSDNITTTVSVILPEHRFVLRMNVSGAHFIGGFRLCLTGSRVDKKNHHLHELNSCQFFYVPNQTISRYSRLSVVLIKVVNQTEPLYSGLTRYDGRWVPTFTEKLLSDEILHQNKGNYLMYTSAYTSLTITFSEQPFFLQNNQKPVIRIAELVFHTLLFCTLMIELFSLAFLVINLISKPIRYFIDLKSSRIRHSYVEEFSMATPTVAQCSHPSTPFYRRLRRMLLREELYIIRRLQVKRTGRERRQR